MECWCGFKTISEDEMKDHRMEHPEEDSTFSGLNVTKTEQFVHIGQFKIGDRK